MRDYYIRTSEGQLRRVRKDKVAKLLICVIAIFAVPVIAISAAVSAKNAKTAKDNETGDIFSRGYDVSESMILVSDSHPETETEDNGDEAVSRDDEILSVYKAMKRENDDFCGYLKIEGTEIEYPVMYTPYEPEKYIDKDINGVTSSAGLPFVDARCSLSPASDNIIIYGHNMRDGSMFGNLTDYEDYDFYTEHPVIRFDTVDEIQEYEVIGAFYDRVRYVDENDYRFYDFTDALDEEDYCDNVNRYLERSIYDTGIRPEYGDELITLVTCSYQEDNGRFIVIAKKSEG